MSSKTPHPRLERKQHSRRCRFPGKRSPSIPRFTLWKRQSGAETSLSLLNVGQILKGRIVEISKDYVVIDVGLKSEGLDPDFRIYRAGRARSWAKKSKSISTRPKAKTDKSSFPKKKRANSASGNISSTIAKKDRSSKGRSCAKSKAASWSISAWKPSFPARKSTTSGSKTSMISSARTYDFKILKINIDRKNIVVSRRELLEEERVSRKAELLENIKEGALRQGVVKNITDFGVFLDLDGIDGLLHITDMTWKRIKHPSEMVHLGQELEVMILHIDREKGRVALGLKQKETNPWEEIEKRYPARNPRPRQNRQSRLLWRIHRNRAGHRRTDPRF